MIQKIRKLEVDILILHDGNEIVELYCQYSEKFYIFIVISCCNLDLIKYRFNIHDCW